MSPHMLHVVHTTKHEWSHAGTILLLCAQCLRKYVSRNTNAQILVVLQFLNAPQTCASQKYDDSAGLERDVAPFEQRGTRYRPQVRRH